MRFALSKRDKICSLCHSPRGYRLAYVDFIRGQDVYYPIGIHWVVMLAMKLWEWSFLPGPSEIERKMMKSYQNGLAAGRAERDKEIARLREDMEAAWCIIANVSGGDWSKEPPTWQMAAERWRDNEWRRIASDGSRHSLLYGTNLRERAVVTVDEDVEDEIRKAIRDGRDVNVAFAWPENQPGVHPDSKPEIRQRHN